MESTVPRLAPDAALVALNQALQAQLTTQAAQLAVQAELIGTQAAQLAAQAEQLAVQAEQIVTLQAQLAARSTQTTRPPAAGPPPPASPPGSCAPTPKKPGRKPGQGPFKRRPPPAVPTYTEAIAVPVPPGARPRCGGELALLTTETVTLTDLPPPPPPRVVAFQVPVCGCPRCGRTVRGQHPAVAPDQWGATAHRVGPRALASAAWLHFDLGLPWRKTCTVLEQLGGLSVTAGALTQAALRLAAGPIGQAYATLRAAVRARPFVHTDDTGWKLAGKPAQLMAFETASERVYQIRKQHRNEEVREVVPGDYAGILITDRGKSYDAKELAGVRQQKCLDHINRSLKEALEWLGGEDRYFGETLRELLWEARALWKAGRAGEAVGYAAARERLEQAVTAQLAEPKQEHRANRRLREGLARQHAAGNLLRFLWEEGIEPTNNRAERALRPAVIARKVSHCSKNEGGAAAYSAFVSVIGTLAVRGQGVVEGLCEVMETGQVAEVCPTAPAAASSGPIPLALSQTVPR